MAEPAAAMFTIERIDLVPHDLFDTLHHELGDAVAAMYLIVLFGIGVDQHHLDLTAVGSIDQAGCIEHGDPVIQGQTAAWQDETGITNGNGDRDTGWHQASAAASGYRDVMSCSQIEAGIAVAGIGGQFEVGVEALDLDIEHRPIVPVAVMP